MQKIIAGHEVKMLDQTYIQDKGMSSFDLMERAASSFCNWFEEEKKFSHSSISVFCGTGNNGGDGLAISRMLFLKGYDLKVFYLGDLTKASSDFTTNHQKLPTSLVLKKADANILDALEADIVIDGL